MSTAAEAALVEPPPLRPKVVKALKIGRVERRFGRRRIRRNQRSRFVAVAWKGGF